MTSFMRPRGAGSATPEKDEALGRDESAQCFCGDETDDDPDCAELAQERKRLATLQAQLARQGVELHEPRSGGLLVAGPSLRAHFGDLIAAESWARQRGGTT